LEKEERSAWFLKKVCTWITPRQGLGIKKTALAISKDIGDIIEKGGFHSKETVMSGNPLEHSGEPRKVLGLRWDTEKDEISVNMKLNYG
jgi:hypothetical protein